MIKNFSIYGLHHRQNINLSFDGPCKILLSENGVGKTTVLNALHAVLTGDTNRLRAIDFEYISISFDIDADPLSISKEQLQYVWDSGAYNFLKRKLSDEHFSELLRLVVDGRSREKILSHFRSIGVTVHLAALRDLMEDKLTIREKFDELQFFKTIKEKFSDSVLYLPTYRRIEENIESLGIQGSESTNNLINFGLADVSSQMKLLREEILQLSNTSFNSVSGDLLTKLINNTQTSEETKGVISKNSDVVSLILSRMGASLSSNDKQKIISQVNSGDIFKNENDSIAYFLARLINAYQKQRNLDESLKKYALICKDYFKNKEVVYDESKIQVDFFTKDTGEPIDIDHLSSGEKYSGSTI